MHGPSYLSLSVSFKEMNHDNHQQHLIHVWTRCMERIVNQVHGVNCISFLIFNEWTQLCNI